MLIDRCSNMVSKHNPIQMGQLFDYGILLLQMCWIVQDAGIQIIDLPLMLIDKCSKGQDALSGGFPCKLGLPGCFLVAKRPIRDSSQVAGRLSWRNKLNTILFRIFLCSLNKNCSKVGNICYIQISHCSLVNTVFHQSTKTG